jgi:hypothetical protein
MSLSELHILAQAATPGGKAANWTTILGLVAILIVGLLGSIWILKKLRSTDDDTDEAAVSQSLLGELKRQRQAGDLTEAEYIAARTALSKRAVKAIDARRAERAAARSSASGPQRSADAIIKAAERGAGVPARKTDVHGPTVMADGAVHSAPGVDLTGAPLPGVTTAGVTTGDGAKRRPTTEPGKRTPDRSQDQTQRPAE